MPTIAAELGSDRQPDGVAPTSNRWTSHRKTAVLKAIDEGYITIAEACERYTLSMAELAYWGRGGLTHKHVARLREKERNTALDKTERKM